MKPEGRFEILEESLMLNPEPAEGHTKNGTIEILDRHNDDRTNSVWLRKQFTHLYAILGLISLFALAAFILTIILWFRLDAAEGKYDETLGGVLANKNGSISPQGKTTNVTDHTEKPNDQLYAWADPTCKSVGVCKKSGYQKPPLLIMSFDGFSHKYLEKKIMTTLESFAECGVKAEKVLPCFPSRTFPNHYAIATGLYPESHGIVDNNIYDPTISPKPESTKTTKHDEFWMGTPIWRSYHDQTGLKSHCLFWPGCGFNISGFKPEVSPSYDKNLKLETRFEMVREWLSAENHPNLVLAYFEQPDTAGHNQKSARDVDEALEELNSLLDTFLTNLHKDGILDCINIAIVSDHGMQELNNLVYIPDFVDSKNVIATQGVIGRLFSANITIEEMADPFSCQKVKGVRVFTRPLMPTRKHHAKISRVGDVVLQGEPGTTFDIKRRGMLSADHGYDIIHDSMHTIFFARGPSFKQNYTVPAFQHIEYMNLWSDLLGITAVPNNGSIGFMDQILKVPPTRLALEASNVKECPLSGKSIDINSCGTCKDSDELLMKEALGSCKPMDNDYLQFWSSTPLCAEYYCNMTILQQDNNQIVLEDLSRYQILEKHDCSAIITKYDERSSCPLDNSTTSYLSSSKDSLFGQVAEAHFDASPGFVNNFLNPLNSLTMDYVKKYERIWVMSGLANDGNYDGVADTHSSSASHFYRIIFACSSYKRTCDDLQVTSFIIPLVDQDINCLPSNDLLMEYSARLMDVELITGLKWVPRNVPTTEYQRLRILMNTKLI